MKSKKSKAAGKKSFTLKIFFIFNLAFIISLVLSYLAAYISPDKFWPIAFFGLAYPVIFLANIAFLVFWLIFRKKYALIVAVFLLLGFNDFIKFVQSSKKYELKELAGAFKVISFNVRDFDIYNYGKHWTYNFTNRNKIFKFLKKEQPDILCFQEYVNDVTGGFKTTDTLVKFLNAKNKYLVYTVNSRNLNYFGIGIYTKYPIIDTGKIEFKTISGNICIYTDIKINSDTVRVYDVHFESIRLKPEDYIFSELSKKDNNKNADLRIRSERILSRIKRAFIARASEVRLVAESIKKCPYPVILCSDFNDTPTSYAYHTIASVLSDAFMESGNGIGQTYAGVYPSFRIDYIMHSKEFKAYNFETVEEEMSDHYPVKCFLKLNKEK
jgi:endonuclease/exonuclease/phosphatase family metal-dependent hydrolase